ncbi:FG-GAP and VCBS repeat-containing protein [Streptomyces rugosispiralis]|uniref:FG-GAP and VCBS repeat-containing protein n=1 Tax=Streptomyces rugosispiralis TaxID=2967341 RepID=UPI0027E3B8D2|nr:FG-GAP and VCBS repeat-containing protein [Streptomyces rugosispiralis]
MRSSVPVAAVAVSVLLLAGCSEGGHEGRRPTEGATKGAAGASLGDFNGDGYDDFATTIRPTSASRGPLPARLAVVYGGPHGLDPRHRLVVSGAEDDYVGPLLRTDLDRDGFTDLVTARFRHGSSPRAERTGETVVLRGGPRGLAAPRPLGGGAAGFLALAVGDFDGDGAADLLASAADARGDGQGEGQGEGRGDGQGEGQGDGQSDDQGEGQGAVRVLYGPFGAKAQPARTAPLPTGPTDRPRRTAPATATAGDFNGDHRTDVVLTYRYGLGQADQPEPGDTAPLDTPVAHYRGGPKGLVRDRRPEARLAHALGTEDGPREPAAGDADHDGIDDLLAPGQGTLGPGRHRGSGRLTVVHGAKPGLGRGRADLTVDQSGPGMPGDARRGDGFGGSPAVGDITGDGRPDLVVAIPEKNNGNGRLTLLPGSRHGRGGEYSPDPAKSPHGEHDREHDGERGREHGRERGRVQSLDLDTPGVPGRHTPYGFDAFAPQPPLLDVDGDGHDDVVAAAPGYGHGRTGGFWVFRGTGDGLSTRDVRHFTPADLGIRFRTG